MDLRYIIKSLKIEMDRKKDAGENFGILFYLSYVQHLFFVTSIWSIFQVPC